MHYGAGERTWEAGREGGREREREKLREKTWLWLNCPFPFSIWMIPLSWHNPSKICLFSIPTLKISQWKNQFLPLHLNQVIVLLFKGKRAQSTLDKIHLKTLIIQLIWLHIFPLVCANIYQNPVPTPSYAPLGSWKSGGWLGAVVLLSLWKGVQLKGQLR